MMHRHIWSVFPAMILCWVIIGSGHAVAQSVASGDRRFVNAALAVLADLPLDIVREIVASESAKAVTALAWKAGLSMRFAVELQMRHAGIQPKSLLYARDGFEFPLSEEDMTWQIEFFGG